LKWEACGRLRISALSLTGSGFMPSRYNGF
jgi:hypothetical protein